jgi:hypothetical protein
MRPATGFRAMHAIVGKPSHVSRLRIRHPAYSRPDEHSSKRSGSHQRRR